MRKIYCIECNKYVGEIRDAKLIKGLAFLCQDCQGIGTTEAGSLSDGEEMFRTLFPGIGDINAC